MRQAGLGAALLTIMTLTTGPGAGAADVGADVTVWQPGAAHVGEHGVCRADGHADISGQGVYGPLARPVERETESTYTFSLQVVSATHGVGVMELCGYMTTSPMPMVTYAYPWLDPGSGDPQNPPELHTWWYASCFDSKGYGGQGYITFANGDRIRVFDFGWKLAAGHKMVALGRWQDVTGGAGSKTGQLVASFAAQGGMACYVPGGAQWFSIWGSHVLHTAADLSWNDVTDPVDPKDDGPVWLLNPWGDKTRD